MQSYCCKIGGVHIRTFNIYPIWVTYRHREGGVIYAQQINRQREFRAVRSAGQKPGDIQSMFTTKLREVNAMVKKLLNKAGLINNPTLVIFGWLAFFASFITPQLFGEIVLKSVARVLP